MLHTEVYSPWETAYHAPSLRKILGTVKTEESVEKLYTDNRIPPNCGSKLVCTARPDTQTAPVVHASLNHSPKQTMWISVSESPLADDNSTSQLLSPQTWVILLSCLNPLTWPQDHHFPPSPCQFITSYLVPVWLHWIGLLPPSFPFSWSSIRQPERPVVSNWVAGPPSLAPVLYS